jgi:hypothetical protein
MSYVRLVHYGSPGADECNIRSRLYSRMPDRAFYLTPVDAADLLKTHAGFRRVDDYASPVVVPTELIESLIRGMTPGREKVALLAALGSMRVTSLTGPQTRSM